MSFHAHQLPALRIALRCAKRTIHPVFFSGLALLAANEACAMKISEAEKMPLRDQAAYIVEVMDAHILLVAEKNLELAKKTELDMYSPSKVGEIYQGVIDIMGAFNFFEKKGLAAKVDVELVCRLVMDQVWKSKGWTHDGQVANSGQFFPKGFQVPYKPYPPAKGDSEPKPAPAQPHPTR